MNLVSDIIVSVVINQRKIKMVGSVFLPGYYKCPDCKKDTKAYHRKDGMEWWDCDNCGWKSKKRKWVLKFR